MKIGNSDIIYQSLSVREKSVLDILNRLSVFGGCDPSTIELVEAVNADKYAKIFSDPKDREIAEGLRARFFASATGEAKTLPGVVASDFKATPLRGLLNPRSIAVVGASLDPNKVGGSVVKNLIESKYPGKLHLVNPKGGTIAGREVKLSIDAIPSAELAVIAIPAPLVAQAMKALGEKGTKNVIVITAGFGETSAEGKAMEDELKKIAKQYGMNMAGPNCVGIITPTMNASFAASTPKWGGVGLISQSGSLLTGMMSDLKDTGFSALISVGNQAGLDIADYVEALGTDPNTRVIGLYAEQISDGRKFLDVASRVSKTKPILLLKGGRSAAGLQASMSHTGSLGGTTAAYEAAARRAGVIWVESHEELLDLAKVFASKCAIPNGARVAIMTNAGGLGILTSDALDLRSGLTIASYSRESETKLRALLPSTVKVGNPTDMLGDANSDRYIETAKILLDDPAVDAIVCLASPQGMTDADEIARKIATLSETAKKPIVCSLVGQADMAVATKILELANIPNFPTVERATRALGRMVEYEAMRKNGKETPTKVSLDEKALAAAEAALGVGREKKALGPETLQLLKAAGLKVVEGISATNVDEAVAAAKTLGYPVSLKIRSPDIIHKSDVGGVVLDIKNERVLRAQYQEMMNRVKRAKPTAKIDGARVQQFAPDGKNVILGLVRDPSFGPMMMFGLGGTMVEIFKDTTFEMLPLTEERIDAMIKRIKAYAILAGARGEPPVDFAALKDAIRRLDALARRYGDRLDQVDINPLILTPTGAIAVDARAVIEPAR